MKWIEFTICLVLDALLSAYLILSLIMDTPETSGLAKVLFAVMVVLMAAGTRITYKEAKNEK